MIEKTFKADDDTSIYYRIFGEENKKTLLLIHGWVTDGRCYENCAWKGGWKNSK